MSSLRLSADSIIRAAAKEVGGKVSELVGADKSRRLARPRQVAMVLCRQYPDPFGKMRSLPAVGRLCGTRDHTTVLHAERRIASLCISDQSIREMVARIEYRALSETALTLPPDGLADKFPNLQFVLNQIDKAALLPPRPFPAKPTTARPGKLVYYQGRLIPLREAVQRAGGVVKVDLARGRIKDGWPVDRAVSLPAIIPKLRSKSNWGGSLGLSRE